MAGVRQSGRFCGGASGLPLLGAAHPIDVYRQEVTEPPAIVTR
jgi:hypothetical protein